MRFFRCHVLDCSVCGMATTPGIRRVRGRNAVFDGWLGSCGWARSQPQRQIFALMGTPPVVGVGVGNKRFTSSVGGQIPDELSCYLFEHAFAWLVESRNEFFFCVRG